MAAGGSWPARLLAGFAWLTIVATALVSTWMMFGAIDDGNPNTRDGFMFSWLLVIIPTGAVVSFWGWVGGKLAERRWSREHKRPN